MIKILHLKRSNGDTAVLAIGTLLDDMDNEIEKATGWKPDEYGIEKIHNEKLAVIDKTYSKEKVRAEISPEKHV